MRHEPQPDARPNFPVDSSRALPGARGLPPRDNTPALTEPPRRASPPLDRTSPK